MSFINKILKVLTGKKEEKLKISVKNLADLCLSYLDVYTILPSWYKFENYISEFEKYSPSRRKLIDYFLRNLFKKGEVSQKEIIEKKFLARDRTLKVIHEFLRGIQKFKLIRNKDVEVVIKVRDYFHLRKCIEEFPPYLYTIKGRGRPKRTRMESLLPESEIILLSLKPSFPLIKVEKIKTEKGREVFYRIDPIFSMWYRVRKNKEKYEKYQKELGILQEEEKRLNTKIQKLKAEIEKLESDSEKLLKNTHV